MSTFANGIEMQHSWCPLQVGPRGFLLAVCALGMPLQSLGGSDRTAHPGSRFVYLDQRDPYYPDHRFPRLTTPMWVGEKGVDAVVILSIDDMGRTKPEGKVPKYVRAPSVYEEFLLPLVNRLKQIQGRAPISIFTCQADPADGNLREFLQEGLSLEMHTYSHPVPILRAEPGTPFGEQSLKPAVDDVLKCLSNLNEVPGVRPVCSRIPGCDAHNTNSPRFYSEVFVRKTRAGDFLVADSSIFMIYTSQDKTLPRELVLDADGKEHFLNYIRHIRWCPNYVNNIRNYPYPYVIDRLIWEFPATVPGDAHGVHVNGYRSPATVTTWKRALDATVHKQGLMTICFHPHGYIKSEQLVELIDYASTRYGKRVRFLNCRDVYDRLTRNMLGGEPLRSATGSDNGVRLLDVNADGYLDAVVANSGRQQTRIWQPKTGRWKTSPFPAVLVKNENKPGPPSIRARFFTAAKDGRPGVAVRAEEQNGVWVFDGDAWQPAASKLPAQVNGKPLDTATAGIDRGVRFRDLNADGLSDLIVNNGSQNAVFFQTETGHKWQRADFALPANGCLVNADGVDQGLRFVDLDGDGDDDLVFSNEREYWIDLFNGPSKGWSHRVTAGKAGTPGALPMIVRGGALNGVWFHSGAMILMNEFTAKEPERIRRRPFTELLKMADGRR